MPIIYQKQIFRDDLQANPEVLYVFGDNAKRTGYGGQAKEMRDEENAVGVRTKWLPSNSESAFFSDSALEEIIDMIDEDLIPIEDHLNAGGIVIIPAAGIGTGFSQLEEKAPQVFDYLTGKINDLVYRFS
jgi:hypothetical protein